jgi:hypothetical protein
MQNKTRYVSIQRGIGGFQPFDALTVDQTGYGDCKALSNYMVSLLKVAGIKGYYTQIYAGEKNRRPVPRDFPIDYFNHIIVAVPIKTDTIWLECTSQTQPFGFLGSFTCDRYGLLITEDGGALVKTPSYTREQNVQATTADVLLDMKGDAKGKIKTFYSGLQYENNGLYYYLTKSADEQKKWVQKNTSIPSFDVTSVKMSNNKGRIPNAVVDTELNLPRYASVSNKRIFLTPNLVNRSSYVPEKIDARKTSFVLTMAYVDTDTIRYKLPEEIYPEFLPPAVSIKSRFGEYEATFTQDQGSLIYTRRLKMNNGEFSPEYYKEYSEFYKNINKADNTKIVFMSKT